MGEIFCVCDRFFNPILEESHSIFMDGACWVCFCCWHSPVLECQDLLNLWDGIHVCRLDFGLYSHPRDWGAVGVRGGGGGGVEVGDEDTAHVDSD